MGSLQTRRRSHPFLEKKQRWEKCVNDVEERTKERAVEMELPFRTITQICPTLHGHSPVCPFELDYDMGQMGCLQPFCPSEGNQTKNYTPFLPHADLPCRIWHTV